MSSDARGIKVQLVFGLLGTRVPCWLVSHRIDDSPKLLAASASSATTAGSSGSTSGAVGNAAVSAPLLRMAAAPPLPWPSPKRLPASSVFTVGLLAAELARTMVQSESAMLPSGLFHTATDPVETTGMPALETETASHRPLAKVPPFEIFSFTGLTPLDAAAPLQDGDVLLVFCSIDAAASLTEALQLRWLERHSAAYVSHGALSDEKADGELLVCTLEEKLSNVQKAYTALGNPLEMHRQLAEKEWVDVVAKARACRGHIETTRGAVSPTDGEKSFSSTSSRSRDGLPLLMELDETVLSYMTPDDETMSLQTVSMSLELCESRLSAVDQILKLAKRHDEVVAQRLHAEKEKEAAFAQVVQKLAAGSDDGSFNGGDSIPPPVGDTGRLRAQATIAAFQTEMVRRLADVRTTIAFITKERNLISKAQREIAVVNLITDRVVLMQMRPLILSKAEALLRRRVILQRAVRRQLRLLQETEYPALQHDLQSFLRAKEVQIVLPEKVRLCLHTPLSVLQPAEDPVASRLDHALIDCDEDEVELLLHRIKQNALSTDAEVSPAKTNPTTSPAASAESATQRIAELEALLAKREEELTAAQRYVEELEAELHTSEVGKGVAL